MNENIAISYEEESKKLADKLIKSFPEIKGISLCGSVIAGNADEYSDIDIDIWLSDTDFKRWVEQDPLSEFLKEYNPYRETSVNYSFLVGQDYKFDLTILSIEKVKQEEWKVEQKANRYGSRIIHDTEETIKNLLNEKLSLNESYFKNKEQYNVNDPNSEDYYKFYISAYLNYHVPVTIARKRYEQAHLNLDWALNLLIEMLWVKHNRFYPYMKSRWFVIDKYVDYETRALFREAKKILDFSEEDVKRRREILRKIYKDLGYEEITFYHEKLDLS